MFKRLVDFPDVIEIEEVQHGLAIPQQAVERAEEEQARLQLWRVEQFERAGRHIVGPAFFCALAHLHGQQQPGLRQFCHGLRALRPAAAAAPDSCVAVRAQQPGCLEAAQNDPAMKGCLIQQWLRLIILRGNYPLRQIIVMPPVFAVVRHQLPAGPERAHDAFHPCLPVPAMDHFRHTRAVLKLQRRERPLLSDGGQHGSRTLRVGLQNLTIMIGPVPLANQRAHRPILDRNQARLLIPGIIHQALAISRLLPVIDAIAGDARLQDKVRIAPKRVERVILHRPQPLKHTCDIRWPEVIEREKAARLFVREPRHPCLFYVFQHGLPLSAAAQKAISSVGFTRITCSPAQK